MKIIDFFKPAAVVTETRDEEGVAKKYKYWRWRTFIGMYVGYIFYYFTRNSYNAIQPLLMTDLGLTKTDLGILGSVAAITYGCSKFLSGILADRSNPRVFMAIGLMMTGVFNILFGATASILYFVVFWSLNGWFQGWGWPPCAKLLTHWYSQKERGTWWGLWNSSHNIGAALVPIAMGYIAESFGWRWGMYGTGLLCIGIGFFLLYCLRDTPQSLGLPTIEEYKNDYPPSERSQKDDIPWKELLFKYVLTNPYIWILAIAYFFVYVVRGAISQWSSLFLMETRGYSLVAANTGILWFEIGGIVGSFVAGWASDKLFFGRRGPVNVIFSAGVVGAIAALWLAPPGFIVLDYILLFTVGFLIFGPQMLIGMVAAEVSHKKAAGTATGFIGGIASLGMATSSFPLSLVMVKWGWEGSFFVLGACGVIAVLCLLPLWSIKSNPKYLPSTENT